MPVRDLVHKMYMGPDGLEELVSRRRKDLTGPAEWAPITEPRLEGVGKDGYVTPGFGGTTPYFGEVLDVAMEVLQLAQLSMAMTCAFRVGHAMQVLLRL